MEHLLNVTHTQRSYHIARLAAKNDPRAQSPDTLQFSTDDMKEVMNTWRKQPETWMKPAALTKVKAMTQKQDILQFCKSRFTTMLFEIFGNRSLVETLIRFPTRSAEQPALVLKAFSKAWHAFNNGPEACRARENSQKQAKPRLSKQIYVLKKRTERGRLIAEWVAEDRNNWYRLTAAEQHLCAEYNTGNMKHQEDELRGQQQPRFPGASESLAMWTNMPNVAL